MEAEVEWRRKGKVMFSPLRSALIKVVAATMELESMV